MSGLWSISGSVLADLADARGVVQLRLRLRTRRVHPSRQRGRSATKARLRVAVIGSGVSGLVAAHRLHRTCDVTVFESDRRIGGHAHTVDIDLDGQKIAVDTGFIVFNRPNYPVFSGLLAELGVATEPSSMTFSVTSAVTGWEWSGTSLGSVFAQRGNILCPRFWSLLAGIVRFNRSARKLLAAPESDLSLGEFLRIGGHRQVMIDEYLIPLGSAIWSADPATFDRYPAQVLFRFLDNHGLLRLRGRPQWRTVTGGSRRYVEALTAGFADRIRVATPVRCVRRTPEGPVVVTDSDEERFDEVILAVHSDQAAGLLEDKRSDEEAVLSAIAYQANEAVLHTDSSVLPRQRRAWAAWNYHRPAAPRSTVAVTYLMNHLQSLDTDRPVCVTLNMTERIDPARIHRVIAYDHPVFDSGSVSAQRKLAELQGRDHLWFCGAWTGYGFHEDGARSGVEVAAAILARPRRGSVARPEAMHR